MNVLVTGGSGTLGRAVCKELLARGHTPVCYSRDRSRQLKYCPRAVLVVGDVRDRSALRHALSAHRVDAVVHTAAVKHVDVCEEDPSLAVASVVGGTEAVLRAVEALGPQVTRVACVSSDKACHRDQVYGICKYLAERLVRQYAARLPGRVNAVRFGNLFGSAGSVLPAWHARIVRGEELPLRTFAGRPARRFAMLPSAAARQLVSLIEAGPGSGLTTGTILCPKALPVVDMGDFADALVGRSGVRVGVRREPARDGEEAHERLYDAREAARAADVLLPGVVMTQIGSEPLGGTGREVSTETAAVLRGEELKEFTDLAVGEMLEWT